MKVCVALVLFLVLWDRHPSLTRTETVEAAEGGNITVVTLIYFSGSRKIFCKNDCNNKEDILVETSGDRGRNGRYSLEYEDIDFFVAKIMYVSIMNVSWSDSGRYRCVVATPFKSGHQDFRIKVTSATTNSHPTYTLVPELITSYYRTTTESLTRRPISSESSRAPELITTSSAMLWDGRPGLTRAGTVYEVAEGGNVTFGCQFFLPGSRKIFCKNDCNKEEDILVETSGNSGCNGRYSIEYSDLTFPSPDIMNVSITNVIRSDSGRYQCVLERWGQDGSQEFRIKVTNEPSFLLLLLLIPVVMAIVSGLVVYKIRKSQKDHGSTRNSEVVVYENCPAADSEHADSTYQSLSVDTRGHNQIYSSLSTQHSAHSVD